MRAVAVGLLIGIGLFCVWWSFWPRDEPRAGSQRPGMRAHLQDDITQAGYASVSPGNVSRSTPTRPWTPGQPGRRCGW